MTIEEIKKASIESNLEEGIYLEKIKKAFSVYELEEGIYMVKLGDSESFPMVCKLNKSTYEFIASEIDEGIQIWKNGKDDLIFSKEGEVIIENPDGEIIIKDFGGELYSSNFLKYKNTKQLIEKYLGAEE